MENNYDFKVVLVGMIYNPEHKTILIGRGDLDPSSPTGWCFPGARLKQNDDLDKKLKEKILAQTGYRVKNLGTIFVRTPKREPNTFIVYFLCEAFEGNEKAENGLTELKWINPEDAEKYFTQNMNSRLKEYFKSLGSGDLG